MPTDASHTPSNVMLAQVFSLPYMIQSVLPVFERNVDEAFDLDLCRSTRRVFLTGCGDSHHAALAAELAIESLAGLPTEPMTAMQMARYAAEFTPPSSLVIGISVSGEVSRTLEAILRARKAGATTIGLTGAPDSRIAQAADRSLLMPTPPFDFAPGVRTYIATLLVLYLTSVRLGQASSSLSPSHAAEVRQEIAALAAAAKQTIEMCDTPARQLAQDFKDATEFVFAGGGPNFATALFSAAKLLEASGDGALGQDTEEWAHLQYFARAVTTPTFIITAADRDASRAAEVAVAAQVIGRRIVLVAPHDLPGLPELTTLHFAPVREIFSPLVACIPGMLFAAHRADAVGEQFFRGFRGGRDVSGGGGISRIRTSQIIAS